MDGHNKNSNYSIICKSIMDSNLTEYDNHIAKINYIHGPDRRGDIPHSFASIEKSIVNLIASHKQLGL